LYVRVLATENPLALWVLGAIEEESSSKSAPFLKTAGILLAVEAAKFLRWRSVVKSSSGRRVRRLKPESLPIVVIPQETPEALVDGVLEILRGSRLVHLQAECALPKDLSEKPVIVISLVLSEKNKVLELLSSLMESGVKELILLALVASKESLKRIGILHNEALVIVLNVEPEPYDILKDDLLLP
jgi:uracil phosphoribosyltransferase